MHPMKRTGERGSGEFEQITWEQAIDEIAERMEATKAQYGPKAVSYTHLRWTSLGATSLSGLRA